MVFPNGAQEDMFRCLLMVDSRIVEAVKPSKSSLSNVGIVEIFLPHACETNASHVIVKLSPIPCAIACCTRFEISNHILLCIENGN